MFSRIDRSVRSITAALVAVTAVASVATAEPQAGGAVSGQTAGAPALKVGAPAPDFTLVDLSGRTHNLRQLSAKGQIVVVEFFNPNCEHVASRYNSGEMLDAQDSFAGRSVTWIVVAVGKGMTPEAADELREITAEWGVLAPVSIDVNGAVATAYGATMTPQAFVIHRNGLLAYMGGVDNNPAGVSPAPEGTVNYVMKAIDEILEGETVTEPQTAAHGCPIAR